MIKVDISFWIFKKDSAEYAGVRYTMELPYRPVIGDVFEIGGMTTPAVKLIAINQDGTIKASLDSEIVDDPETDLSSYLRAGFVEADRSNWRELTDLPHLC
jgi:hypothetical protein